MNHPPYPGAPPSAPSFEDEIETTTRYEKGLALKASVADVTAIATRLNAAPPNLTPATQSGTLADMGMLISITNALDVAEAIGPR